MDLLPSGQKSFIFTYNHPHQMKANELLRILTRDGWYRVRQSNSHIILKHPLKDGNISFPAQGSREVPKGLLIAILKKAKINFEQNAEAENRNDSV
jgi:predicted RNA binding protein YcfA (HicA-like mRNA interferase family)